MANFLFIHDPDTTRRQLAARQAHRRVAFLPHLRAELALAPTYAVTWAAAPGAPVEHFSAAAPEGTDGLLFGEPHDDRGGTLSAPALAARHDLVWDLPSGLNGYYAALMIHPRRGVRVEADVLGIFPIYYWQSGEVLLVASSPELFRSHPCFAREIDLHGVAALLLTSGLAGGRTLWRGVHRLGPDHVLFYTPATGVRELAPSRVAAESPLADLEAAVTQASSLHVSFLIAALRHSRRPGLQLSGGLDSRLLAGFATTLNYRPECVTFGRAEDLDARCAAQVARELDLPQTLYDVAPADYAAYATSSVVWEQLSGGLYAVPMGWNLSLHPPAVSVDRMICGLTLDAVLGGPKQVATGGEALSFERLRIGCLGYDARQLAPLLASSALAEACADVRAELVRSYLDGDDDDPHREWRMNLAHRHRFAVGACAWRYSLYAWPVMPALDRRLLRLAARLPWAVVQNRQVQTRMLVTRFPRLAQLDLDRNYLDTIPLLNAPRSLAFDVQRRLTKLARRCQARLGRDPRFYVRTMAFNGPGWRVVRSLAEQARAAARPFFKPAELARVLPDARVTVRRIADPIVSSAPLKNTLGLMLWLRQHA